MFEKIKLIITIKKLIELLNTNFQKAEDELNSTNEKVDTNYNELVESIDNEATARENADTVLQTSIEDLTTVVQENYSELEGSIESLTTVVETNKIDSENRDIALNERIDNIDTELSSKFATKEELTTLDTNLSKDIDDLDTKLSGEIESLNTITGDLQTDLGTLEENLDSYKESNDKIVSDLSQTVQNNYSTLDKKIDGVDTRLTEVAEEINQTIEDNVVALQQEDTALQNQINTHSQQITQEITDRQTADSNLQTQITANTTDISELTQVVQDDYDELKGLIDQEIEDRGSADTTLQNNINAEAKTRKDTDDNLQDQIDNLKARGRFLALWNATTGLPESTPQISPYTYNTGDYFIVDAVGETNYRPIGTEFVIGQASAEIETEELATDDVYYFDGATWHLQINHGKTVSFANLAGEPSDNTNLKNALDDKVSFTDYPVINTTAGVIKVSNSYATNVNSSGFLTAQNKTVEQYANLSGNAFISKNTLDNIQENYVTEVGDAKYQPILTAGNGIEIEDNKISTNTQFVITEDMFDLEFDDTKGVTPYNASYGYTNITIHEDAGIEWVEGASYTFVINTKQSSSAYRNLRFRIGESGDWKPAMVSSSVVSGSAVFAKTVNCIFFYKTTYQANGALHVLYDTNTTYTLNYSTDAGSRKVGVGTYAVDRYSLIMQKPDLSWEKITNTSKKYSIATTKSVNTNGFLLNQIRYYKYTTAFSTGVIMGGTHVYSKSDSVAGSYSFNCGTAPGWTVGDSIFLVGTIGEDELFYLDTAQWWSNSLPTENDGKLYIQLGYALSNDDSTFSLLEERPILYHDGTSIKEYIPHDKTKQDVIEDLGTIRSNAEAGKEAKETIDTYGDIVTHNVSEFQEAGDYATNTALTEGLATKQDVIENLSTIESNAQAGKTAKDTIDTYGNIVTHNVNEFQIAGDYATNSKVTEVETTANNAKAIAEGKATGYVFDTKEAMDSWVQEHSSELKLGDNLYIRAVDVPDYWWDGEQAQQLETQKVDLTNYTTKTDLSNGLATKQDTISNLSTIESNASNGNTAYTTIQGYGDIVSHNAIEFALKSEIPSISGLAKDSDVVHKAQNETITGIKTFQGGSGGNSVGIISLTGMLIGAVNKTAYTQYGTIRQCDNKAHTGSYYINSDGSLLFRHKTGTATAEGSVNDAMLTLHPVNGLKVGWSGQYNVSTTADKDVLVDTIEYSKLNTTDKTIIGAINEVKTSIPSLVGYATESYVQGYHDNTKQDVINDLDNIRSGAELGATALQSYTETDPIYTADKPNIALKSELFSKNYNDLTNKPAIPTKTSDLTNDSGFINQVKTINGESIVGTGDITIKSAPDLDNITISKNSNDELQAIAVIDNNNNAIKTWTGTQAEYEAIAVKDSNTLYNVTDTNDVSYPLLEAIYPVGSIYIGTMAICPLQALFGTWQLVATKILTDIENIAQVVGNGMTLGLTNGSVNFGLTNVTGSNANLACTSQAAYGAYTGASGMSATTNMPVAQAYGITTDATKSGMVATVSSSSYICNLFRRTA